MQPSLPRAGELKGNSESLRKQQEPLSISIQVGGQYPCREHILTVTRWENISKFRDTIEFEVWKPNKPPTALSNWCSLETVAVETLLPRGLVLTTQIFLLYCRIKNNVSIAQTDLVMKSESAISAGFFLIIFCAGNHLSWEPFLATDFIWLRSLNT